MKILRILAVKDVRLLWRDKLGFFWVLGFPLLMALFFGTMGYWDRLVDSVEPFTFARWMKWWHEYGKTLEWDAKDQVFRPRGGYRKVTPVKEMRELLAFMKGHNFKLYFEATREQGNGFEYWRWHYPCWEWDKDYGEALPE